MVASLRPDVVTLDLNIPEGGGQYALEQIMRTDPFAADTDHDGFVDGAEQSAGFDPLDAVSNPLASVAVDDASL